MMGKILRALFYRSVHDGVFWLLIALTFLLCALFWNGMNIRSIRFLEEQIGTGGLTSVSAAYGWEGAEADTPEKEREAFYTYYVSYSFARMLREVNPVRFLSLYAAAYLIGTLFTRGTIRTMICRGHGRGSILGATLLYYGAVIALSLAASVFFYLALKFGARSFALFASIRFWRSLGLWLLLALAAMMPQFACAYLIRNLFGTLLADFVLMLAFVFLPTSGFRGAPLSGTFADFLPLGIMEKEALWTAGGMAESEKQVLLVLIPLAILLSMALFAYFAFRKQDIR